MDPVASGTVPARFGDGRDTETDEETGGTRGADQGHDREAS